MKITKQMVVQLNSELENMNCPFRYEYYESDCSNNPHMRITLINMNCVDSFIINPTKDFFDWLKKWFESKGIELSCNNDGSILWSKNGWY